MKNAMQQKDQTNRVTMFSGCVNSFKGLNAKKKIKAVDFNSAIIALMLAAVFSIAMVCDGHAEVINTKLNGEWQGIAGDVAYGHKISPDGNLVVYVADQDTDGVNELYSIPIGGGETTKLNGDMVMGGDVGSFSISPDSSRVVYAADQDTDQVYELYSVSIGGGTAIKLNDVMVNSGKIYSYIISPDSSRVVYCADQDDYYVYELYSVPIGGGTVTKLNDVMVSGGDVYCSNYSYKDFKGFSISPDSSRVVYCADQDTDKITELYSVPIGGGTITKLNDTLISSGDIYTFKISLDSSRVVYCGDQDTENIKELYSVPIEGGIVTKLNTPMVNSLGIFSIDDDMFSLFCFGYEISPDSSRVVYLADQDTVAAVEMYSVPIGGGTVTKLNDPLASGFWVHPYCFQISPDSSQLIYIVCNYTDEIYELFSVPIGGGTPTKLDDSLPIRDFRDDSYIFALSADSSRIVYPLSDGLYSIPIGGGGITKLNNTLVSGGEIDDFKLSTDSSRVVYLADQDTDEVDELYSVPIDGGTVTKLNNTIFGTGGSSWFFSLSPDSSRVVYRVDQDIVGVYELYSTPIGGGTVTKLNGALVNAYYGYLSFLVSPNNSWVVYLANQDTDSVMELYSVPVDGGPINKLNNPIVAGGDIAKYSISPDSSRVIYLADQDTDEVYELYSVPIGGGEVTKLNDPMISGGDVSYFNEYQSFAISPDSSRVVYRANQEVENAIELYSVPIGGGTVTKLNDPIVMGLPHATYGANYFEISADSTRVVYVAYGGTAGSRLFSVPIEGGGETQLSQTPDGCDTIQSFLISSDNSRVVYVSGCRGYYPDLYYYDLLSVPIDGGAITKLFEGPPGGSSISLLYELSADNSRVVYKVDQDTFDVSELYSVPIGGGTSIKLNDPMVIDGEVYSYKISADSSRIVYRADQDTDTVYELYSVPVGGGTVSKLNAPIVSGGDIISYDISTDSSRVVFRADQDTDEIDELFSVPLLGGIVTKLNDNMVSGDNVFSYLISPDSSWVAYSAYHDMESLSELYRVPIAGGSVTKVNDPLLSSIISQFAISADSSQLVYSVTHQTLGHYEKDLYSSTFSVTGDFNNDGCVDRADYYIIIADIRGPAPHDMTYDLNEDGDVNIADARFLARLFTNPRGAACE